MKTVGYIHNQLFRIHGIAYLGPYRILAYYFYFKLVEILQQIIILLSPWLLFLNITILVGLAIVECSGNSKSKLIIWLNKN